MGKIDPADSFLPRPGKAANFGSAAASGRAPTQRGSLRPTILPSRETGVGPSGTRIADGLQKGKWRKINSKTLARPGSVHHGFPPRGSATGHAVWVIGEVRACPTIALRLRLFGGRPRYSGHGARCATEEIDGG